MTTLFVSRHPGALDSAAGEGITVDTVIAHLDPEVIEPGDVVIGTCRFTWRRGSASAGRYLHLSLEIPPDWRAGTVRRRFAPLRARLEGYWVSGTRNTRY